MSKHRSRNFLVWVLLVGLVLCYADGVKAAEPQPADRPDESLVTGAGLGLASLLATIPYGLAKIGYALTGAVAGGLEYAWSGGAKQPAQEIWDSALGGTYILTPDHLRGRKPIKFLGDTPEREPSASPADASRPQPNN
jgi:hypothetical protein